MALVTGRVFIALNGDRIRSKEGAKLETGGLERKAQISDAGVDGHSEAVTAPKVTCKISHTAKTSLMDIHAFKGTLTFETDTGRVYTLIEAWSATPPTLASGESDFEFGGVECLEG